MSANGSESKREEAFDVVWMHGPTADGEGTRVVLLQLRCAGFNVGRALFSDDNGDGQGAWRLR